MSRLLLRHRSFLLPGARSDASHPFAAASSSSRSSYTSRFSPLAYHASAAATAAGAQSEGAAAESTAAAGDQPSSTPPPAARGRWGLLKFGALAAVAGAIGGVGYVTYGAIPRFFTAIRPAMAIWLSRGFGLEFVLGFCALLTCFFFRVSLFAE